MSRLSKEDRRAQLLDTALRLFSESGFDGTSTRSIADAAGVTEALVFHYFPTKLALFHSVIVTYGVRNLEHDEPVPAEGAPLAEVLAARFDTVLRAIWKNRVAFRMLLDAAFNNELASEDMKIQDTRMTTELERLLTGYEASGAIKPGTAIPSANIISYALRGFIFVSLRSDPENWDVDRTFFVKNLLEVILPNLVL